MPPTLTVVMYHYVKPQEELQRVGIPGLPLEDFRFQMQWLCETHEILDPYRFIEGDLGSGERPAALLTFDDAYQDHYRHVLPVMQEFGVSGIFFVPAQAVEERRLLDVNKIHHLLAAVPERRRIIEAIHKAVLDAQRDDLQSIDEYLRLYREGEAFPPGTRTFDDKDTTYIKRMLQVGLPRDFRAQLVDDLLSNLAGLNEHELAEQIYCSIDQLREMREQGMMLGGHGYVHDWLGFMPPEQQEEEIARSRAFLDTLAPASESCCFAYPYGSFNEHTCSILQTHGFRFGFTTLKGHNETLDDSCHLKRLDTNDLPRRPEDLH